MRNIFLSIKVSDEFKWNVLLTRDKPIEINKNLIINELKIKCEKECKLKDELAAKMNGLNKQSNECKNGYIKAIRIHCQINVKIMN